MTDFPILDKFANAGIVAGCVAGVLSSFALWAEMGRAAETAELSKRAAAASIVAAAPAEAPGEAPAEDALIEAALVEQGYFRDDVPLSYELQEALHTACEEFNVPYSVMLALIEKESNFNNIIGDNGESVGYCQIQQRYWNDLMLEIGCLDLYNPSDNFRTGCAILRQLLDKYGSVQDALTAYNSGHPGSSAYTDDIIFSSEKWGGCIEWND